jgi:hypothetical protein
MLVVLVHMQTVKSPCMLKSEFYSDVLFLI